MSAADRLAARAEVVFWTVLLSVSVTNLLGVWSFHVGMVWIFVFVTLLQIGSLTWAFWAHRRASRDE